VRHRTIFLLSCDFESWDWVTRNAFNGGSVKLVPAFVSIVDCGLRPVGIHDQNIFFYYALNCFKMGPILKLNEGIWLSLVRPVLRGGIALRGYSLADWPSLSLSLSLSHTHTHTYSDIIVIIIIGTALCEPWPSSELFAILPYCRSVRLLLLWISEQLNFYGVRLLASYPTPQPGGPVYPSSSRSYPLTCPAWVALSVATLPPA
jgi:hypothetical protein